VRAAGLTRRGPLFLMVGAWNTLFGLVVFTTLNVVFGDSVSYMVLLTITWIINVFQNYVAYRYIVFRVEGHWWRDLFRFALVNSGAFAFNLVALPFGVSVLGLPVIFTQVLVTGVIILLSFILHGRFSFHRPAVDVADPFE
jgi:putative flippase GtrA